ncbi:RcpC/CpaB family pilus assembly protein [Paenibacillus larvae]|uniref:RcpC/CpaB family pilus assembly protein n=1 Tax=Paenibacillus larvae TaxID=1464 RepID=UPI0018E92165|nr:RcpC/CpaB family pilus assembly protein [Paenibacillus larvae]MCY7478998.1 RcpC/CpaB family pilus assembly protein [Paenibacillus larvae]MCY7492033.1 RcpC/CpaB family pilus assembly protein [Paenibacillus larvae]MCY9565581.1 RcpC/CpaB family pilus assembly protein [Paenibacillus larvae]MCY9569326.1 RcpC/CpaB family pilus assembly protein [Paenibacillus larvae]MCY9570178.1 RcpC/CpaB family pilus assembly protein [Paenibacillus larvae]
MKSLAAGLSGKLQPGDIVSLIAADYSDLHTTIMPPELQYVEVLSVTTSSGLDAQAKSEKQADTDEKELPSTLTLLVLPHHADFFGPPVPSSALHHRRGFSRRAYTGNRSSPRARRPYPSDTVTCTSPAVRLCLAP